MTKILIAEDSLLVQDRVAKLLIQEGYAVTQVSNGMEVVERYYEQKPDMVLLDVNLPVKSGLTALEEILAYDPQANVIMVTGIITQKAITTAIQMGAKDFLMKPVAREKLLAMVAKVLASP